MRNALFLLLFIFIFTAVVQAETKIIQPPDKTVTLKEVLQLKGFADKVKAIKINNLAIELSASGVFSCGLIVKPGKNFVVVKSEQDNPAENLSAIRLLRLNSFPDMQELYNGKPHWAKNEIIDLATLGIVEGYQDGFFYPDNPVTRGELATWLARLMALPLITPETDVFYDVPKEHWRAPYIKAVVKEGYLGSQGNDLFGINDFILRRKAAEVAVTAAKLKPTSQFQAVFLDVSREADMAEHIYCAYENGLFNGVAKNALVFDPNRELKRSEAAAVISRFKRAQQDSKDLHNFDLGYNENSFCGINVAPQIMTFLVKPNEIQIKTKAIIALRLTVAPRNNFSPISKVKVDLSLLGGAPDVPMFDDGTNGDKVAGDLTYSLNVALKPEKTGSLKLTASVIDNLGWETKQGVNLLLVE